MLSGGRTSWRLYSRCLGLWRPTAARYIPSLRFQSSGTLRRPDCNAYLTLSLDSASELISPILLQRARSVAAEHQKLSAANAENYDVAVAKKIGELGPTCTALKDWEDANNVRKSEYHVPQTKDHGLKLLSTSP